jgi:hypothetical protein
MEPFDTKTIRFDGLNLSQQQLSKILRIFKSIIIIIRSKI